MSFISLADSLKIILQVLLPHTTHRLQLLDVGLFQLLDVGLFQLLSTAYSAALTRTIYESQSFTDMTKRIFWTIFKEAWEAAFTVDNIKKAWAKADVYPIDASKTLSQIKRKPSIERLPENPPTPMTCRAVRRMIKASKTEPEKAVPILFRSVERLATQHEIDTHINQGLRKALAYEKQKRRKGKRLNLLGEDSSGPQLFSPSRVQAAKAYQAQKEAAEEQKRLEVAEKKAQGAEKRLQKEKEREEKALQRATRKQEALVAREEKRAEIQARKEAKKAAKEAREAAKSERIAAEMPKKASIAQNSQESGSSRGVVEKATRSGRVVKIPHRLRNHDLF